MKGKDAEAMLNELQTLYNQYKQIEQGLQQNRIRLGEASATPAFFFVNVVFFLQKNDDFLTSSLSSLYQPVPHPRDFQPYQDAQLSCTMVHAAARATSPQPTTAPNTRSHPTHAVDGDVRAIARGVRYGQTVRKRRRAGCERYPPETNCRRSDGRWTP